MTMTATAKTRKEYIDAWTNHVHKMIHIHMESGMTYEEWLTIEQSLLATIERAASKVFPAEKYFSLAS